MIRKRDRMYLAENWIQQHGFIIEKKNGFERVNIQVCRTHTHTHNHQRLQQENWFKNLLSGYNCWLFLVRTL